MTQVQKFQFWSKRLSRGLAVLFALKMMLIAGAITMESCQSQEEEFQTTSGQKALDSFEAVIRNATPQISKIMKENPDVFQDKGEPMSAKYQEIEEGIRNIMMPVVKETKVLLKDYNVDESFLQAEFGDSDDPRISLVGLMILAAESQEKKATAMSFAQALGTPGFAKGNNTLFSAKSEWADCLIVAVGIDVAVEFFKGNVTETISKKALKKLASRALGWIGAAVAAYEFGSCMNWY